MAHSTTRAGRGTGPFDRVSRREQGYNMRQVDQFLDRARQYYDGWDPSLPPVTSHDVRTVSFDPARGGYDPRAVDSALDRLEDAFAQRERDELIAQEGEEAWLTRIGRLSSVLRARLHRAPGDRFRRPSHRNASSYNVQDVDALCGELLNYFEQDQPLSVDVVRRAVFREAKGSEGYEENQVDAFLERVVELMATIE
ncbi:DivIVA domain-containing protein [Arthrobacter sp. I2-34]|uniref:DivIVA domain-containing protein n=1 Tax=Arthrobacter hankyongi TaxID=2904801 RepID=A0ABS9L146_9MICC|nr:DivIVA domain-containing protein [Arthrobacter hankyongi]MCG2620412.1 DivIVA domain-containing protein [Arthrobacter hankyongi]